MQLNRQQLFVLQVKRSPRQIKSTRSVRLTVQVAKLISSETNGFISRNHHPLDEQVTG